MDDTNELVLRLQRVCGLEITLKDGDATVPWPDEVDVELEHSVSRAGIDSSSGNRFATEQPGEHTLTLEPIDGFLPVPPQRVMIEPAKWTHVELQLQHKA